MQMFSEDIRDFWRVEQEWVTVILRVFDSF